MEAKKIVHGLLEKRLIACASIIPEVESIFRWSGQIEEAREVKVILKTVSRHFAAIRDCILSECSYDVPEITQIDITGGHLPYLTWVEQETSS
jgi:periplasmic divalent cation tolerance protein